MLANNASGTTLIRENALLPAGLAIESEVFLRGWRVIKNLDRSTLARNIEGANWTFSYLAGEIRATVLDRDRPATLRRVQQGVGLSLQRIVLRMPAAEEPESALGSGGERHHRGVAAKQYVALISSS